MILPEATRWCQYQGQLLHELRDGQIQGPQVGCSLWILASIHALDLDCRTSRGIDRVTVMSLTLGPRSPEYAHAHRHFCSRAVAQVVALAAWALHQALQGQPVGFAQVVDVDVVADAGAIGRVVVAASSLWSPELYLPQIPSVFMVQNTLEAHTAAAHDLLARLGDRTFT